MSGILQDLVTKKETIEPIELFMSCFNMAKQMKDGLLFEITNYVKTLI